MILWRSYPSRLFASVRHATAHAADNSPAATDHRTAWSNATSAADAGRTDDGFGPIGTNGHRANKGAGGNGYNQKHSRCLTFPLDETYYDRNKTNP